MKRKKFFITILLVITYLISLVGCEKMKYDNKTNKDKLITKEYTTSKIDDLKSIIQSTGMSFDKFQELFKVQCVRKTCQGYYVILRQEDEKNVYVFFNNNHQSVDILIVKDFITELEFKNIVENETTESEVLMLDSNTIFLPVSAVHASAHIVQEGVFIIKYSSFSEEVFLEDPIVHSIEFVKNEDILLENNDINYIVPLILPIDKVG